jgi:hypothetical protein
MWSGLVQTDDRCTLMVNRSRRSRWLVQCGAVGGVYCDSVQREGVGAGGFPDHAGQGSTAARSSGRSPGLLAYSAKAWGRSKSRRAWQG